MKIAFFGGTFDPVHRGHLAVARAAMDKFGLNFVYFAPADIPPHKQKKALTDFQHRYAMLALATAGEKRFVPSLLDAYTGRPNYSIDTVRRFKSSLGRPDKLYFLIGMDAFQDISTWRSPVELLAECEFIVVSRPGYSLADAGRALPQALRPADAELDALIRAGRSRKTIVLPGAILHLLEGVHEAVSSTQIRAAARKSVKELSRLVPQPVAEYIKKERLYAASAVSREPASERHGKMLSLHRRAARSHRYE
jgi:nicotinate-nucleotide adenylyltransferase